MARLQQCPCGSGEYPEAQHDARGIFLCYTCDKCEKKKIAGYRPGVLNNSQYEAYDLGDDEEIYNDGMSDDEELPEYNGHDYHTWD
jgi:hypothetical protein